MVVAVGFKPRLWRNPRGASDARGRLRLHFVCIRVELREEGVSLRPLDVHPPSLVVDVVGAADVLV